MYLFGYGSLINLSSAQKSFKRRINQRDLIPVQIKGYDKVWNSIEHISFDENEINGIFLNLQKNDNVTTNGVIIKITPEELEFLKLREKNYSCISLPKECVTNMKLDTDMITFMTTNEKKIAKSDDENTFIPSKYIDILTNSFSSYNEEFVEEFKKCLVDLPFKVKEGTYKFSDPIQNKFAKDGLNGTEQL